MKPTIKAPSMQLVIVPAEQPKETRTGIHLPENAKSKIWHGHVIAAGPDTTDVRVGDVMYYPAQHAKEVEIIGEGGEIVKLVSVAVDVCLAQTRSEG
jgi:co-chaperonin GroES (HSP10)